MLYLPLNYDTAQHSVVIHFHFGANPGCHNNMREWSPFWMEYLMRESLLIEQTFIGLHEDGLVVLW